MVRLHEDAAPGNVLGELCLDAAADGLAGDARERPHDPLRPRPRVTGQEDGLAVTSCRSGMNDE